MKRILAICSLLLLSACAGTNVSWMLLATHNMPTVTQSGVQHTIDEK
jgi:uncharacterized lipoprotein YmbA